MKKLKKLNISISKKLIIPLVCLLLLAAAIPTLSWLSSISKKGLVTLTRVEAPISIEIGTSNEGEFAYLDLGKIDVETSQSYREYVFNVWTKCDETIDYYLYLAHTTNIGFEYTLYEASEYTSGTKITYLGEDYTKGTQVTGAYFNEKQDSVTGEEGLGKTYADNDEYYIGTYRDYTNVQKYGIPLYWKSTNSYRLNDDSERVSVDGTEYHSNYYVLRVSWDPEVVKFNRKETDMIYFMVRSD